MLAFCHGALLSSAHTNPAHSMRLLSAAVILTLSAVVCTARAAAPEQVEIAAGTLKLHAQLY